VVNFFLKYPLSVRGPPDPLIVPVNANPFGCLASLSLVGGLSLCFVFVVKRALIGVFPWLWFQPFSVL